MVSDFKRIVESVAKEKGEKVTSFQAERIRVIERKLDAEEISIEEAVNMLRAINDGFDKKFRNDDFLKVDKKVKRL